MQSLNLIDYIKVYNVFNEKDLNSIIETLKDDSLWSKHLWTNNKYEVVDVQHNEEHYVADFSASIYSNYIMEKIYGTLVNYFTDVNIKEMKSWQGYTAVRYNRYSNNQSILKHVDKITSIFDGTRKGSPILSIVGLLNDNFNGGDFIMFDNYKVKLKAGDIMLFPSSFQYPHLVTPVIEGTRYSFVSWSW